ncbi:MAG: IS3 family transposase, partial [Gammaproteobacteria bacterium]
MPTSRWACASVPGFVVFLVTAIAAQVIHPYTVAAMRRVLTVARSGFYGWCGHEPSRRTRANERLLECIRQIHLASRRNYGTVKTWRALRAVGVSCSRNRVARLRRNHGIEA